MSSNTTLFTQLVIGDRTLKPVVVDVMGDGQQHLDTMIGDVVADYQLAIKQWCFEDVSMMEAVLAVFEHFKNLTIDTITRHKLTQFKTEGVVLCYMYYTLKAPA